MFGGALLGMTVWVFSAAPGSLTAILDPPFVLLALMMVAAFRTAAALVHNLGRRRRAAGVVLRKPRLGAFRGGSEPLCASGRRAAVSCDSGHDNLHVDRRAARDAQRHAAAARQRRALPKLRRTEFRGGVAHRAGCADGTRPAGERADRVAARACLYRRMQFGVSEAEPPVRAARHRFEAVARRCALVRDLPRAHRDGGATGIFDRRPAIHLVHRFAAVHLHHEFPRRHATDGNLARVWCVARDVTELVDLNDASAPETGAIAAVRAAIGRRRGARAARHGRGSARWHRPAIGRSCDDASRRPPRGRRPKCGCCSARRPIPCARCSRSPSGSSPI